MKFFLSLLLFVAFPLAASDRILLVASNNDFDLEELAQAHAIFMGNRFAVDVATPEGGQAQPKKYDERSPVIATFLSEHQGKLETTLAVGEVDTTRYAAMFIVGGSGAMFELPSHRALQRQIGAMADRGAVIGAVCHGPAALLDVVLANGRPLLAGRRVSGFTDEEEARFGGKVAATYPFSLEKELGARGAAIEKAPPMLVQVVRDGLLVTGQNPFSTSRSADEVIRALGRTPLPRSPDSVEATVLLIAELLREGDARQKLDANPAGYDPKLIATYGAMLAAGEAEPSDEDLRRGLLLLEVASRHFSHPRVESALERAHLRLAERKKSDHDPAKAAPPADRRRE
jgi:putative intracellular protease/amidase